MKKKNTAIYELMESTGKEIEGIRKSVENLEQLITAIGMGKAAVREEEDPEVPDPFLGGDEMDIVEADEDGDCRILLVDPGKPYEMIGCVQAMEFMDHLKEPCEIILEEGGYIIITENKNVHYDDDKLYICSEFMIMAREEEDIAKMNTGMLCDLVNYFSRNTEARLMNGELVFRIRFTM